MEESAVVHSEAGGRGNEMIFGIFRTHGKLAYGKPLACYLADDKQAAWLRFCCEYSIDPGNKNYKVVAV